MSELVVLTTGESETIYGTYALAKAYLAMMVGDQYTAWRALTNPDDQKRLLATARRKIDRYPWIAATAGTFALRDALVDPNDVTARPLFQLAEYELAALGASDPSVLSAIETGSNVRSAGAGSARVEFFRPTSLQAGTSNPLPDVAMQLVGGYLASVVGVDTNYGQSGNCESTFDDSGEFDLVLPK